MFFLEIFGGVAAKYPPGEQIARLRRGEVLSVCRMTNRTDCLCVTNIYALPKPMKKHLQIMKNHQKTSKNIKNRQNLSNFIKIHPNYRCESQVPFFVLGTQNFAHPNSKTNIAPSSEGVE